MSRLRLAVEAGFRDLRILENHPELAPLRGLPEFEALLEDRRKSGR